MPCQRLLVSEMRLRQQDIRIQITVNTSDSDAGLEMQLTIRGDCEVSEQATGRPIVGRQ